MVYILIVKIIGSKRKLIKIGVAYSLIICRVMSEIHQNYVIYDEIIKVIKKESRKICLYFLLFSLKPCLNFFYIIEPAAITVLAFTSGLMSNIIMSTIIIIIVF